MRFSKLWSFLHKVIFFLLSLLIWLFRLIFLIFKLGWLLLKLLSSLVLHLFNRLLPSKQPSKSNPTEKTSDQNVKTQTKSFIQKILSFNLSNLEQLLTTKIKSFEQTIPKRISKWFPQKYIEFDNSKLKVMTLEEMKHSSNQVLLEVKTTTDRNTLKDLTKKSKVSIIKQTRIYYVPTYLRVKVKNFTAIDLDKLEAQVNVDVIISFVYGNDDLIKIPKEIAVRLLNEVVLNFQRDDPLKLDEADNVHISTKEQMQKYHIQFTVRKKLHMRIESRVYYTPFQQLYLILPITIQQLTPKTVVTQQLNPVTGKMQESFFEASIKFNYMDNEGHFIKLDFTDEKHFGYYSLIETGLVAKYSNKRITSIEDLEKYGEKKQNSEQKIYHTTQSNKTLKNQNEKTIKIQQLNEQKQLLIYSPLTQKRTQKKNKKKQASSKQDLTGSSNNIQAEQPKSKPKKQQKPKNSKDKQGQKKKIQNFQYSFFEIPIYKHPMASLVMIFLPLWSLAIINLGIFFQQNSLSERIASIASLMIAFIALNETIRSQITPHPQVVFVELLVYAEIIACFLCLVNSYEVSQIEDYKMEWTECETFIISLGIFIAQVIILFVMSMYHYYVMVPSYQLTKAKPKFVKIQTKNWRNDECDKHFDKLIQDTIKALPTHKGLKKSKKLKDINQEMMKKGQKPSQKVDSQDMLIQVLKSLSSNMKKTQMPMSSQSININDLIQSQFQQQKISEEKPQFKKTVSKVQP